MRASSYLKKLYNLYNKNFFNNRLPQDTTLYYAPKLDKVKSDSHQNRSMCAVTYWFDDRPNIIVIRRTKTKSIRHIVSDLLHEMCHLSAPYSDCEKSNTKFQREMKRLANAGAFYNVW
jgi:hypothetical protein